jgi:hypothetical protein
MKHRKFVFVSTLIMLGIAGAVAGVALYTNYSVKASAPSLPDALGNLPSNYQFVFGINVPKFVASPAYARFRQNQNPQIGNDLALFIEKTGVDPARDVSYLVAAGRSGEKAKGEGVVIVVGTFNRDKITTYIRSKTTPVETEYGGVSVLMIPERSGDAVSKGIVFLNAREIALGDLESLKAVVDVKVKGNRSILLNPTMASLINGINPDEMFWFAGDASSIMARAPVTTPLGTNISSIQSIVGTLNVNDAVTGKITAVAANEDAATKLADVVRGFVALGQLTSDQNPDLKTLLSGLAVSQNSTQISVTLNFPADLIEKLDRAKRMAAPTTGS